MGNDLFRHGFAVPPSPEGEGFWTIKNPAEAGFSIEPSGLGGRAHGAHTGASAAGHAGVRIDIELAIALRDGGNGTFLSARAAGDALVTDLICHDKYLLFFCWNHYTPKP